MKSIKWVIASGLVVMAGVHLTQVAAVQTNEAKGASQEFADTANKSLGSYLWRLCESGDSVACQDYDAHKAKTGVTDQDIEVYRLIRDADKAADDFDKTWEEWEKTSGRL